MQTLPLNIDTYLKYTVVEFHNTTNYSPHDNLIGSVYQALRGKVDVVIENFANNLKKRLSKVISTYNKRKKENPSYLASFSQSLVNEILSNVSTTLLIKNPSIIVAEPTAEDTLFFTAQYGEKTCYIEVYFEENETPTCTLNIFENKKTILSRVGTVQNVLNTFLTLDPTFTT